MKRMRRRKDRFSLRSNPGSVHSRGERERERKKEMERERQRQRQTDRQTEADRQRKTDRQSKRGERCDAVKRKVNSAMAAKKRLSGGNECGRGTRR